MATLTRGSKSPWPGEGGVQLVGITTAGLNDFANDVDAGPLLDIGRTVAGRMTCSTRGARVAAAQLRFLGVKAVRFELMSIIVQEL